MTQRRGPRDRGIFAGQGNYCRENRARTGALTALNRGNHGDRPYEVPFKANCRGQFMTPLSASRENPARPRPMLTVIPTYGWMKLEIFTHGDALRHTAKRVVIAVCSTVVLTLLLIAITFGTDPDTSVRLGSMATHGVLIGMIIAALLTGVLTYRSSVLMRELNGARSELLSISRTDQLTG